jgi:myo-inositol-1(or 4)-monophosphatase
LILATDWSFKETALAIEAVEGGLGIARGRAGAADITSKGGRDLVTATDVAVEDAIRERLADVGHPVVGEERGGESPADGSPYWLIDPICGTRNFASGIPLWCVNLALVVDHHLTIGVVADGSTGEVCVAERGGGALARGTAGDEWIRLTTSAESQAVAIEDSRSAGARREHAARYLEAAVCEDRWDLRALGTSLSLAHVAAGRLAGYVLFWSTPIHCAAGVLLASEAGATVSQVDGWPWTLESDWLVVSAAPEVHRELLRLARSVADGATQVPESS